MDKDSVSNDCMKSGRGAKDAFIFGSWKCRNLKKRRSGSNVAAANGIGCNQLEMREKSPFYTKSITANQHPQPQQQHHHQQSASLPAAAYSSSSAYDTYSSSGTAAMDEKSDRHPRRGQRNEAIGGVASTAINASPAPQRCRNAISVYGEQLLQEHDFWCPRCNRKMEEPRLLPCLHSVCSGCVAQFMSKDYCYALSRSSRLSTCSSISNGYEIPPSKQLIAEGCPICDFPLPKFGSPAPPPHYSLQHRLVIYAVRRRLSQRAICCDTCPDEVQATQHCPTCLSNFCQDCGAEHEAEYSGNNREEDDDDDSDHQQHRHRHFNSLAHKQRQSGKTHHASPSSTQHHQVRPLWEAKSIRHVAVCLSHPSRPLRYLCLACQQVTCKECMWQGAHRGHASEDAASAGARAAVKLSDALKLARALLNRLLLEYDERAFERDEDGELERAASAFDFCRDSLVVPPQRIACHHSRSRSAVTASSSSHSRQARERIREYSRLKRARYLIDAVFIGEDLLATGSDVEVLSLKRIVLKRLRFLGVPIESQQQQQQAKFNNSASKSVSNGGNSNASHTGIFHCCTFCSSGGKKEATCACGGTMPGGYKGCGHGHPGHPGVHHWTCCGSIYRDGSCLLPRKCTFKITL